MIDASPFSHLRIRPAIWIPASLPSTEATSSSAAAPNTAAPPTSHLVRSPVLRKNTGITASRMLLREIVHLLLLEPLRVEHRAREEGADHEVQPDQSAANPHIASQISPTYQRSRSWMRRITQRTARLASAKTTRKPAWRPIRSQSSRISASTPQIATSSMLA